MSITTYLRQEWEQIAAHGEIHGIMPQGGHYVTVTYRKLSPTGEIFVNAQTNNSVTRFSDVTIVGFSINWNNLPPQMLKLCVNVFQLETLGQSHLGNIHEFIKVLRGGKLIPTNFDLKRGGITINDGIIDSVLLSTNMDFSIVASELLEVENIYNQRIAMQRTTWYRWLSTAKYIPKITGNVFSFPNGLSVKMDDGSESFASDGHRLFCETYDQTDDITRHETEADFLVWLTKYF